jgi:ABC-type microcin C transport system permease subunit YejE
MVAIYWVADVISYTVGIWKTARHRSAQGLGGYISNTNDMIPDTPSGPMHDDSDSIPIRVLIALRRSFFLSLAVFGTSLVILGMTVFDGVLAGMFGIWGLTALLIGGVSYTITRYLREDH